MAIVYASDILPNSATKTSVGLSNVDNTSDADKPISTATQAALDAKPDTASDIGLGNVDNTSDADKPISTAVQAALDAKVSFNRVIVTANHTAVAEQCVAVDTSVAAITVTAPANPGANTRIFVGDCGGNASNNNIIIDFGAESFNGVADTDLGIKVDSYGVGLLFTGSTWRIFQ